MSDGAIRPLTYSWSDGPCRCALSGHKFDHYLHTVSSLIRDELDRLGWISVPAGVVQRGTPAEEIDVLVERLSDIPIPRRYLAKESPRMSIPVAEFTILRVPLTVG